MPYLLMYWHHILFLSFVTANNTTIWPLTCTKLFQVNTPKIIIQAQNAMLCFSFSQAHHLTFHNISFSHSTFSSNYPESMVSLLNFFHQRLLNAPPHKQILNVYFTVQMILHNSVVLIFHYIHFL